MELSQIVEVPSQVAMTAHDGDGGMIREVEAEIQGKKPESTMFDTWKGKQKFLDGAQMIEQQIREEPSPPRD